MSELHDLALRQRRRLIATVLGALDEVPMGAEHRDWLKERVRAAVGIYHDVVLDLLGTSEAGVVWNVEALDLLERIAAGQEQMQSRLAHLSAPAAVSADL